MNIQSILEEAKEEISLIIKDGVYFLVETKDNNLFTHNFVIEMNKKLDIINSAKDIKCLIVIGKGQKIFSSGFDLKLWKNDPLLRLLMLM